tara:strand:+ start:306 stop:617 length:312 start_codon:yes stop_codon:yes gene_type:complete
MSNNYDWSAEDSVDIFGEDTLYMIKNVSDMDDRIWDRLGQHIVTEDSAKYNNDKSKIVLKYRGHKPEMYGEGTVYTNAEIIEELKKDEWLDNGNSEDEFFEMP